VAAGKITREDLQNGFSLSNLEGRLQVGGLSTRAAEPRSAGAQASLLGAFDIGVIPATRSCPPSSDAIVINMDDEDSRNAITAVGGSERSLVTAIRRYSSVASMASRSTR
jgi:hypothetical protein